MIEGEKRLLESIERTTPHESADIASVINEAIFPGDSTGDDMTISTIGFDDGAASAEDAAQQFVRLELGAT